MVGDNRAERDALSAFDIEAIAPHLLGGHAADGDVLCAREDAETHAPLTRLVRVLPRRPPVTARWIRP